MGTVHGGTLSHPRTCHRDGDVRAEDATPSSVVKRKTFSLGQIKISDILPEVLKAVRTHHVKMVGDLINTVISIPLLEGIGRQLDPGLDLFKSALPILRQLGIQMSAQESMTHMPSENFGLLLKVSERPIVVYIGVCDFRQCG
jgi:predicted unusual protein kinase regulating ubiquinone biosynthesis (AarF/ABC1/UbiB family)